MVSSPDRLHSIKFICKTRMLQALVYAIAGSIFMRRGD
jgi:hypothetical protein